tara:strand:+ start:2885 stop:3397 length:513 start_codon:yes stop_codon:yes gene_type:complete
MIDISNIYQILKKHNLMNCVPFDIEQLSEILGVSFSYKLTCKDKVHAFSNEDNTAVISSLLIESRLHLYIKAYTLYFAANNIKQNVTLQDMKKDARSHPDIYKANCFAESILMPEHLIIQEGKRFIPKEKKWFFFKKKIKQSDFIVLMAERFKVDESIMENRLRQLNILK